MRTVSYEVRNKVWAILGGRVGKARAITQNGLAKACGISARVARDAVKHLIEDDGIQICSDYKGGGGYYLPESEAEVEETREILRHHARSILKRAQALGVDINELQMDLFGGNQ